MNHKLAPFKKSNKTHEQMFIAFHGAICRKLKDNPRLYDAIVGIQIPHLKH